MNPTGSPRKIELVFFRNESGGEPVRNWLKDLSETERRAIGRDLLRARSGGGPWARRFVTQWEEACGNFAPILPAIGRRAF